MTNIKRIICGDNLEIMKSIPDESVDLVYADPPFFSNRNYEVIWNDGEELRQFGDRWITENKDGTGKSSKDINIYISWMKPRIQEIYRILKSTGSFYLHCDFHANHYLKILCDQIFGYNNYQVEILWHYTTGGASKKIWSSKTDTILMYTKGKKWTFNYNKVMIPYSQKTIERLKHAGARTKDPDKVEKIMNKEIGKTPDNVWNIASVQGNAKESSGYPTQKPEALLERIIMASSNKDDIVMDPFCGCGTTIAVANRLDRNFIGIDVSPTACRLIAKRVNIPISGVEGLPATDDELHVLAPFEFQNWVNREIGSKCGPKGADKGIDGWLGEIPIQVKQMKKVGRKDIDTFQSAIRRVDKRKGIFISFGYTTDTYREVARLKSDEDPVDILLLTVEEIRNNDAKDKIRESKMAPKDLMYYDWG